MNIRLISLIITNFKGIRSLVVNFNHTTEISGKNASYKSTIRDAYHWVNWGKNAEDKEDFNIKNTVNTSLNRLEHSVEEVLNVDGEMLSLKRIYREIWSTTRGDSEKKYKGNETLYEINGVSKSQKEFQGKVDSIMPIAIAKLITNPYAFNSLKAQPGLTDWQVKREVLVKIAGEISNDEIFTSLMATTSIGNYNDIIKCLNSGQSLIDFKKEIASKKKKIRETLDYIPARIDEAERGKPEPDDFVFIAKSIENKNKLVVKIDEAITDKVRAHREVSSAIIQNQNELSRLKMELLNLESEATRKHANEVNSINIKVSACERDKKNALSEISTASIKITALRKKNTDLETENATLRIKWSNINAEELPVMDLDKTICPSCKQELPADRISEIKSEFENNFNKDKTKRLESVNLIGQNNNDFINRFLLDINEYEQLIKEQDNIIHLSETKRLELNAPSILTVPGISNEEIVLKKQISEFVIPTSPIIDDAELKQRKSILQTEISDLQKRLAKKELIEQSETRVKELELQEQTLSQEIATLEQTEFSIESFSKAKMDEVQKRVNVMFKSVKFQMFETQINEGIKECCICLVEGVPFADANTASQINAGLDIINTLQGFYNIYAPVWIDRAESVNKFFPITSQLIKLVVTLEPLKIS